MLFLVSCGGQEPTTDSDAGLLDADIEPHGTVIITRPNSPLVTRESQVTIEVFVDTTEAVDGVTLTVNSEPLANLAPPYAYSWNIAELSEGDYRVVATAQVGGLTTESEPLLVTIDRTAPWVESQIPGPTEHYALPGPLTVVFSEPLDPVSVSAENIRLRAGEDIHVPAELELSEDGTQLALTPGLMARPIAADSLRLDLSGLTDLAGNVLEPTSIRWMSEAWTEFGPGALIPADSTEYEYLSGVALRPSPDGSSVYLATSALRTADSEFTLVVFELRDGSWVFHSRVGSCGSRTRTRVAHTSWDLRCSPAGGCWAAACAAWLSSLEPEAVLICRQAPTGEWERYHTANFACGSRVSLSLSADGRPGVLAVAEWPSGSAERLIAEIRSATEELSFVDRGVETVFGSNVGLHWQEGYWTVARHNSDGLYAFAGHSDDDASLYRISPDEGDPVPTLLLDGGVAVPDVQAHRTPDGTFIRGGCGLIFWDGTEWSALDTADADSGVCRSALTPGGAVLLHRLSGDGERLRTDLVHPDGASERLAEVASPMEPLLTFDTIVTPAGEVLIAYLREASDGRAALHVIGLNYLGALP
jgi:hypothetical protein